MKYPTINTKLIILLGNPLGHSISPQMHNHVFETLGIDYCYMPVEVTDSELGHVFNGLKRMNVDGFNVTIPHKVNIINYLDELDPIAKTIGAVNTIAIRDGSTIGYNTDGEGFIRSLTESTGLDVNKKTFYLIGCGGAARAIAMTLAFKGAGKIFLNNRTEAKAIELAGEINNKIRNCAEAAPSPEHNQAFMDQSDVVINCTSLGMHPKEEILPLDPKWINQRQIIADIVYTPLTTRLLDEAKGIGCQVVPGLGMLIHQGAAAFKIWTGREPLTEEMATIAYSLMNQAK